MQAKKRSNRQVFTRSPRRLGDLIRNKATAPLVATMCVFVGAKSADAVIKTWDGDTSTDWANGGNWSDNTAPQSGDVLVFDAAGSASPLTNTLVSNAFSLSLTFNSGASAFTMGGTGFTLGGNITNNATAAQIINHGMVLTAQRTVSMVSGGSITLGGILSGTGGGLNLTGSGGTVTLSGSSSTMTGATVVGSGVTLNINKTGAFGTVTGSNQVTISGGAILNNTSGGGITTSAYSYQFNGDFTYTGSNTLSTGGGSINLGTAAGTSRTINVAASTLTLAAAIANGTTANSVIKTGAGTLALGNSSNAFTGPLVINGGTVSVANYAAAGVNSSWGKGTSSAADLVFGGGTMTSAIGSAATTNRLFTIGNSNGLTATIQNTATTANNTISFTNTGSIAFGGTGARSLTLSSANTGNSFAPQLGDGAGGATTLIKAGSGAFIVSNALNSYTGGTQINAGTLNFSATGALSTGPINFTGNSTLQWGTGVALNSGNALSANPGITGTLDIGTNNVALSTTNALTGGGNLTKAGTSAGTLTISAANNLTGNYTTSSTGGATILSHGDALQSAVVVLSGTNKLTFNSGIGTFTVGGLSALSTNLSLLDSASAPIALNVGGGNASASYSGILSGIGASLVKIGSGNQTLGGTSTFTGGVIIKAGTISMSNTGASVGTGGVTIGDASGSANAGLLGDGRTFSTAVTLQSGTNGTLYLGNSSNNSTVFSGTLAFNNHLTLSGFGTGSVRLGSTVTGGNNITLASDSGATAALSGANTAYFGTTTLVSGTGSIQNANALGTGTFVINGGALQTNAALVNAGNNAININNGFTFSSSAANTYNTGTGAITVANSPVDINVTASNLTLGGAISGGAGGLTKSGAGTLTLGGANTIAGNMTVTGGILALAKLNSLNNTNFTVNSGATLGLNVGGLGEFTAADIDTLKTLGTATSGFLSGSSIGLNTANATGGTFTYANAFADTNGGTNVLGINKLGAGTLVLTANNTNTGTTTVSGGILQVGSGGTVGSLAGPAIVTSANTAIAFSRSDGVNLSTPVSGAGFVNAAGGLLTLASAGHTFTGGISAYGGGTLTVGLGALPTNLEIALGGNGAAAQYGASNLTGGHIDLGDQNYQASRLQVSSNSGLNTLKIHTGRTLTVNGNFFVGTNLSSGANVTEIDFIGGGNLVVSNNTQVDFGLHTPQDGTSGTPGFTSTAADLSALNDFTVTSSNFYAGNVVQGSSHSLTLAKGANLINANDVLIGAGKGEATVQFNSSTGTLTMRGKDGGTNPVASIIVGATPQSGGTYDHSVLLNDHTVDILATSLSIASINGGNSVNSTFNFNQGTVQVDGTLIVGRKTGSSTTHSGTSNGVMNVSGTGSLIVGAGGIQLAPQSGTGNSAVATATLTLSGSANLTVGTGGILLSSHTGTGTSTSSTATLNLNGGTAILGGHILDGGGTSTSTLSLNGASLDMQGFNIGSASVAINNLTFAKGTLKNVNEINGGSTPLTKTTGDTLIVEGVNGYTGGTVVSAGTLLINGSTAAASAATVGGAAATGTPTIGGGGIINGNLNVAAAGGGAAGRLAPGNSPGMLTVGGNVSLAGFYDWEFDNAGAIGNAGTNYDQLLMTGGTATLAVGGVLNVSLTSGDFTSSFWNAHRSWKVIDVTNADGTTGNFSSIASAAPGAEGSFTTTFSNGDVFLNWTSANAVTNVIGLTNSTAGNLADTNNGNGNPDTGSDPAYVSIIGSNGSYVSEVDGLTANASTGLAVASQTLVAPQIVMLWLADTNGENASTIADLVASLDGQAGYDIALASVDNTDPLYATIQSLQSFYTSQAGGTPFSALVRFTDVSGGPNVVWDFAQNPDIVVDRIAIVPEPASFALAGLGALGVLNHRRRRKSSR